MAVRRYECIENAISEANLAPLLPAGSLTSVSAPFSTQLVDIDVTAAADDDLDELMSHLGWQYVAAPSGAPDSTITAPDAAAASGDDGADVVLAPGAGDGAGADGAVRLARTVMQFDQSVVAPILRQADDPTDGVVADTLLVQAQKATHSTNGTGGGLDLRSGIGPTADGEVFIRRGTTDVFATAGTASTRITSQTSVFLRIVGTDRLQIQSGSMTMTLPDCRFHPTVSAPQIQQSTDTAADATGELMTIHAQDVSGSGTTITGGALLIRAGNASGAATSDIGGDLTLSSGTGTDNDGELVMARGATNVFVTTATTTSVRAPTNFFVNINSADRLTVSQGFVEIRPSAFRFADSTTLPVISQEDDTTTNATGELMTQHSQDVTGGGSSTTGGARLDRAGDATGAATSKYGGDYDIRPGNGATAGGKLTLQQADGTPVAEIDDTGFELSSLITATFGDPAAPGISSGTLTLDFTVKQKLRVTLTENVTTVAITDPPGSGNFMVEFVQDGTGGRTVTGWPANVLWPGGTAPTFGDGANTKRLVSLYYDGPTQDDYYGGFEASTYS